MALSKAVVRTSNSTVKRTDKASKVVGIASLVEGIPSRPFVLRQRQRRQHPLSISRCTTASTVGSSHSNRHLTELSDGHVGFYNYISINKTIINKNTSNKKSVVKQQSAGNPQLNLHRQRRRGRKQYTGCPRTKTVDEVVTRSWLFYCPIA